MKDDHSNCSAAAHLLRAASEGCAESRLLMSRRAMLGVTASLFSWAYMPRFAEAAGASDPRLLIVVLEGGMDGINVCVPFGDSYYVSMRGSIAIPAASTIKIDSFFGLHPALKTFGSLYKSGDAAVVNATCVPLRNRSHFDTRDNLQNGMPDKTTTNSTGWLNRLLSALPAGTPIKSAGAVQIGPAPLILRGPAPVLGWSAAAFAPVVDPTLASVRSLYQQRDAQMSEMLELGLKANSLASPVDQNDGTISPLRKGFRGAGRLLAAADGPRIAVLSVDGFDTHVDQGGVQGQLGDVLAELDNAIADFKLCVGAAWTNTAMVLVTEFGRKVRINGDKGTDHGVGTVALLAGGAVNGGKMFGDWPGLAPSQLYEDTDLKPTTDLRSVFKGVLRDHVGVPTNLLNSTIFPQSTTTAPPLANLLKSSPAAPISGKASAAAAKIEPPIAKYRRAQGVSQAAAN